MITATALVLFAFAQETQAIEPGQTLEGRLEEGDETIQTGEFCDSYTLHGTRGQRIRASLSSTEFDPYLLLRGPGDFSQDNDDLSGTDRNSRVEATLPADGDYTVGVTSFQSGETGAYSLTVEAVDAPVLQGTPIAVGTPVDGRLEEGDSSVESGKFADVYTFAGRQGQAVRITMHSGDFDTLLVLEGPEGFRTQNDDGQGMGTDSLLQTPLPSDGDYTLTATSYGAGMSGAYTLTVEDESAARGTPDGTIAMGQTVEGTLAQGDDTLATGEFCDSYTFHGGANQRLDVTLGSADFDPYLLVRGPGEFAQENDDVGQGSRNSRIVVTLPESGDYRIIATSYRSGETGAYSLRVAEGPAAVAAGNALTIEPEQELTGRLADTDPARESGQHYVAYAFDGHQGQRTVVSMRSTALDTYLLLRGPDGYEETNDDVTPGRDRNSRIDATLPADGRYEIWCSSYRAGETGEFRVSLSASDRRDAAADAPPAGAIELGTPIHGELAAGDATQDSGEFADTYTFHGTAGQAIAATLESDALDPVLIVHGPDNYSEQNDDFAGMGRNSRLDLTLPADGEYRIVASSYRSGETGAYLLRVRRPEDAPMVEMRGRVFGVFCGITDYQGDGDLPNCAEDAVKLHAAINETGLLAPESVLLTNAQVTHDAVRDAIAAVGPAAGPDDVFIFFFSGHGDQTGRNVEGEPDGRNETIILYDHPATDDEMAQWYEPIRARVAIVALDSCHAGGFARDVVVRPNRMGIFSSEEDVTSNVAGKFQAGGYLSYFLRMGLLGDADDDPHDNVITVGELTQYIRRQWSEHVQGESAETSEGARTYQNLVIERGGVKVTEGLLRVQR